MTDAASGPLDSRPAASGDLLRRYRAFAKLGRGGMADIYLAIAEGAVGLGKVVVIKRMRADVSTENEQRFRSMFFDEARLSTQLNHPCIIQMYEAGEEQGNIFMVMEYAEGHTLQELKRFANKGGERLTSAQLCRIMIEVLSGLHYAHELRGYDGEPLNIVHRDVSPQNIMVGYDGRVRLLDFGIAKAAMQTAQTEVGILKGKIRYMSPEQVSPTSIADRRADIFSVGVVLWELITGKRLFPSDNELGALVSLVNPTITAARLSSEIAEIHPDLDAIVAKSLEKAADNRFATALEMKQALEGHLRNVGQWPELETIGEYTSLHFATQRRTIGARISAEMNNPRSESESQIRTVAKLDMLGDLAQPSGNSAPTPLTSGTLRVTAPPLPAPVDIPVEFSEQASAKSPRRVIYGLMVVALLLLGTIAYLLARPPTLPTAGSAPGSLAPGLLPTVGPALVPVATGTGPLAMVSVPPTASALVALPTAKRPTWPLPVVPVGGNRPAPTATASTPPTAETRPEPAAALPRDPGFLTLDTYPWTRVSEGGRVLGTTPMVHVSLSPGVHVLSLDNPTENVHQTTTVTIKSGETVSRRLAF